MLILIFKNINFKRLYNKVLLLLLGKIIIICWAEKISDFLKETLETEVKSPISQSNASIRKLSLKQPL